MEKENFKLDFSPKKLDIDIINLFKKGFNPSKISRELKIARSTLNYHLATLKELGIVKKTGYGLWEINNVQLSQYLSQKAYPQPQLIGHSEDKEIRGHAFIWKIKFNKQHDWKSLLTEKQINYDEMGIQGTPRIILNGKKIWLGKKHVIIYLNSSFFASNSIESKKMAIYDLLKDISSLEQTFARNLGNYKFTCAREHYALVHNVLAEQCDREGKSILIKNEQGYWMSIDNSLNLHEAEAISNVPDKAVIDALGLQKYFNSHNATGFKVTPEFTLDAINKVTNNQMMFAQNIESHIKAIQDISKAVNELRDTIKELKDGTAK